MRKNITANGALFGILGLAAILGLGTSCYGTYFRPVGTMLWHLDGLSSQYDDMNAMAPPRLELDADFAFSSNRLSAGADFDIVRAGVSGSEIVSTDSLLEKDTPFSPFEFAVTQFRSDSFMPICNSAGNEKGPWMRYEGSLSPDLTDTALICNPRDPEGAKYHYFFDSDRLSGTGDATADRDIYYYNVGRDQAAPHQVAFNSAQDDAYPCLISLSQGLVFSSNRAGGKGGWDIYLLAGTGSYTSVGDLAMDPAATAAPIAALNSEGDDLCPFFLDGVLVFVSNRGGRADYDIYYSTLSGAAWSDPKPLSAANVDFWPTGLGSAGNARSHGSFSFNGHEYLPSLNSANNEFRPVLVEEGRSFGSGPSGIWLVFSSDRSIAEVTKGGYDLYLAWLSGDDFADIVSATDAWRRAQSQ
jgi:hypothetical protein